MSRPTQSLPWSIGWSHRLRSGLRAVWERVALRRLQPPSAATSDKHEPIQLTLRTSLLPGQANVAYLVVEGQLNRQTYLSLIEAANLYYQQGHRYLLLDLRQTTQIELSGLFALLSIAQLYSGQPLLDPEAGWVALRQGTTLASPVWGERVKLLAPSPAAVAALQRANFCRFFTRYPDIEAAMTAFPTQ